MPPLRVLLIADDTSAEDQLRPLLSAKGATPLVLERVATLQEGLTRLDRESDDLGLIVAPVEAAAGADLLRRVFASRRRVPIVLLTGSADPDADLEAILAGAADCLPWNGLTAPLLQRALRHAHERAQVFRALRESEQRFRALVENSSDLVILLDPDGVLMYASLSIATLLGYPVAEVIGRAFLELAHPADTAAIAALLARARSARGQTVQGRFRLRHGSGEWRDLATLAVDRTEESGIRALVLNLRDVTSQVRMEQRLQESEARFRLMADSAPVMIWVDDTDGNRVFENRTALEFTGRTLEGGMGLGWLAQVHPDDRARVLERYAAARADRRPWTIEHRIRHRDGNHHWILGIAEPRFDPDGSFAGYTGCDVDVTDLKASSDELRKSGERYRAFLEHSSEGIFRFEQETPIPITLPPETQIDLFYQRSYLAECNEAMARMYGYESAGELVGVRLGTLLPDSAPENLEYLGAFIRSGYRLVDAESQEVDREGRTKFFLNNLAGVIENGCLVRTWGTQRDVTAIHQATEALRSSEERYRIFLEQSSDAIYRFEIEGGIPVTLPVEEQVALLFERAYLAECNSAMARMYGYEAAEEILGRRMGEFTPLEDPRSLEYRQAFIRGGYRLLEGESYEVDRFGRVHFFLNNTVGIVENGRLVRTWGTQRDLTRQRALEERLRQSQKIESTGRLAGGIAHDFNNLLTAILGTCDILLSDLPEGNPNREDVVEIKQSANRAASLTRQLLAFSRRQVLQARVLDLNALVRNSEKMLKRLIGEDIFLLTALASDLGAVRADPTQLEQVIMNLVVNARDAMPAGGTVRLDTANLQVDRAWAPGPVSPQPGPYVLLTVSDTGVGMSREVLAHLFEPFFTTKELGKGTGLGLATVYGIVKQSGGYIFAESAPGKGTEFKVYLPRVEETPESVEQVVVPIPVSRPGQVILLVEDEESVRRMTRRVLQNLGYHVLEAAHGGDALQIVAGEPGPIHLLVTDIVMPGMSGQQLAAELKAIRPDLKVLYMSGYSDDAIVHRGTLGGDSGFIQKPFTPATLAVKLAEILRTED
jgi:PAS domain S-box-containing protein